MITQKELKELLHYDPETGIFTRIVNYKTKTGYKMPSGYIKIVVKRESHYAHRLAWLYMTGEWPKEQIDHINHIRFDNKWDNLREASNQENGKNASMKKNNTSGITGVYWNKERDKWQTQIMADKVISLGRYIDFFEACCARKSAERKYGYHENHGVYQTI